MQKGIKQRAKKLPIVQLKPREISFLLNMSKPQSIGVKSNVRSK